MVEIGTPELEIISPEENSIAWITEEPKMPEVICKARMKNYKKGNVTFEWEYWVSYELSRVFWNSRLDEMCSRFGKSKFKGTTTAVNDQVTEWVVQFKKSDGEFKFEGRHNKQNGGCEAVLNEWYEGNDVFTGGYIFLQVTAKNNSGNIIGFLQMDAGQLLGKNPNPEDVIQYTEPVEYRAIIKHESKTKHFNFEDTDNYYKTKQKWLMGWKYNKKGYPIYGPPNGFGLAQIDNRPAPTEMDLWNWKHNLNTGRSRFDTAKDEAMEYIENENAVYDEEKFLMNAYQNYNAGKKRRYWDWDAKKRIWKESLNKGTLNPEYGKKVYDVLQDL